MRLRATDVFAALDFETARPQLDTICQIGCAIVDQKARKILPWSTLVRPEPNEFSRYNTRVHGIDSRTVENAPTFEYAWPELAKRLEPCVMLAAHGTNDRLMLERSLANIGRQRPVLPWIDTVKLARRLWPGQGAKLAECAERLGLSLKAHDAKSDAIICARIVLLAIDRGLEIEADVPPRDLPIELSSAPVPDPLPPPRDDAIKRKAEFYEESPLNDEFPVWMTKFAKAGEAAPGTHPLVDIFTFRFSTDAHFAAYVHPTGKRISRALLREIDVHPTMRALVVDVDAPKRQPDQVEEWKARAKKECAILPGAPFGYFTRSGLRLVWRIRPFFVRSDTEAANWSRSYARALVSIYASSDRVLLGDIACKDWQRLYRVPKCVREGVPHDYGTACGDPSRVGWWSMPPLRPDRARAEFERLAGASTLWAAAFRQAYPENEPVSPQEARVTTDASAQASGPIGFAANAVLAAVNGTRNRTLYIQARWLRELANRGEIDWMSASTKLADAAISSGLSLEEVGRTIRSAER